MGNFGQTIKALRIAICSSMVHIGQAVEVHGTARCDTYDRRIAYPITDVHI
jgi:hypothetical protein